MKKYAIEIKWGFIFTLAALLWMVFEKSMGWHDEFIADHALYTNFFSIVAVVVYVFALIDKRNNFYDGMMSWKEGFVSGLIISLIIAALSPLAQWITIEIITPEYFPNVIKYSVENGLLSQEEAEATFNLKSYMIQSSVFALIVGALTSAIVALFVKRK